MNLNKKAVEVKDRIVVFDSNENPKYLSYRLPSMVVTRNGVVCVACEAYTTMHGDWSESNLLLKRSLDGGQTWQKPVVIAQDGHLIQAEKNEMVLKKGIGENNKITFDNTVLIADRNGTLHVLYCVEYARIFYRRSDDDGITFSEAVEITSALEPLNKVYPWKVLAVGPGHGIQLRNGRLLVAAWISPGTGAGAHHPSVTTTIYSDDHGLMWKCGEIAIPCTDEWIDPNEAVVAELSDGRVVLNARSESAPRLRLVTTSQDGISQWSRPAFCDGLFEPICAAGLLGVTSDTGRILLFSAPGTKEWLQESVENQQKCCRSELMLHLSYDEGVEWPDSILLAKGNVAYSDLAEMPDGSILCLYEELHPDREGLSLILIRLLLQNIVA